MAMRWHAVPGAAGQVQALAASIANTLTHVIEEQGSVCLVVSSGCSPIALFAVLRVLPLRWADVSITLVDERAVPSEHANSNARLVHGHLLQDAAAAACSFPLVLSPHAHGESVDVDTYVATASDPFQQPDVVILGMDDGGHTASLFPDVPELNNGIDCTQAPAHLPMCPGAAPCQRISLNLSVLCAARRLFLSISGLVKRGVFDEAARGGTQRAPPVSYVIHQREVPLDVYWTCLLCASPSPRDS